MSVWFHQRWCSLFGHRSMTYDRSIRYTLAVTCADCGWRSCGIRL